jgi:hypothetical protein
MGHWSGKGGSPCFSSRFPHLPGKSPALPPGHLVGWDVGWRLTSPCRSYSRNHNLARRGGHRLRLHRIGSLAPPSPQRTMTASSTSAARQHRIRTGRGVGGALRPMGLQISSPPPRAPIFSAPSLRIRSRPGPIEPLKTQNFLENQGSVARVSGEEGGSTRLDPRACHIFRKKAISLLLCRSTTSCGMVTAYGYLRPFALFALLSLWSHPQRPLLADDAEIADAADVTFWPPWGLFAWTTALRPRRSWQKPPGG